MKIEDIKSGDKIAIRSNSFLSKVICYFMKQFAEKNLIKYDWIGSHLATCFWDKNTGNLLVAESVDNGFHFREFKKHYDLDKDDIKILTPKIPYTDKQISDMWNYAMHLQTINLGYQYWNFIQWILYIETKINLFGKGGKKFTFCYESTYLLSQITDPINFDIKNEIISFFDVYYNKALYIKN